MNLLNAAPKRPRRKRSVLRTTARYGLGIGLLALLLAMGAGGSPAAAHYWVQYLDTRHLGYNGQALGINASGHVFGIGTSDGPYQGFLYDGTQIRSLGDWTVPTGINALGQVVGKQFVPQPDGTNPSHPFLFDAAGLHDLTSQLTVAPGKSVVVSGINSAGQIVGGVYDRSLQSRPFLFSGGVMIDLGTLGGGPGHAYAINDAGQVVGLAATGGPVGASDTHAFLVTPRDTDGDGKPDLWFEADPANPQRNLLMKDLGTFGGRSSSALALNALGQVAGGADGTFSGFAFFYGGMSLVNLGHLSNGPSSIAYGVNTLGQVVGRAEIYYGLAHAFLWENGVLKDLNDLIPADSGWTLTEAHGINDRGQIACVANHADGGEHHGGKDYYAVILTPYAVAPPPPPSAPANLTITATSAAGITLTWSDTSVAAGAFRDSTSATGFEVERRTDEGAFIPIASVAAGATSVTDTAAALGVRYTYRVRAINTGGGSSWSEEVSGAAGAPGVGFTVTALSLPDRVAFGEQAVGTPTETRAITLTNTGTATLLIGDVTLQGPQASEFAVVADTGEPALAPGGKRVFTLQFTPASVGARAARLVISDNAPGSPHHVELNGLGIVEGISASPAWVQGIAVFRPVTAEWFSRGADGRGASLQFGAPGDMPVPADYLGLGRPQIAVFRPSTREWFLRAEDGRALVLPFGGPDDVPVPGDYLGLGRAQIAVFRTTTQEWFLRRDDGTAEHVQFGGPGDVPVPGDYFGLGRVSIAVFRPDTADWFLRRDDGRTERIQWGTMGDVAVPGDFLALHRAQIAVYRPRTAEWFVRQDDGRAIVIPFGGSDDVPVPRDYFGVGRLQIGVYRPGTGEWFLRTDAGRMVSVPWGGPEDVPVPASFASR